MRILVAGGAGFIGSHLCEELLALGHEVICLDNFFTGRKENILHLMDNNFFEVIRHDIIHPIFLEIDLIYNLACPASPVHYQFNPIKTVKTNVMGVINMLGLAKRTGARILQASTSEVYGDPTQHPQTEEYWGNVNTIGIRSCYDEGKRVSETLVMDYHRQNKVDTRLARIFNTFGPKMLANDGRVVSNFIVQALTGKPITIYGEGSQTRSFCYVSDTVDALIKLAELDNYHLPVNIGNPEERTILDLATIILEMTQSTSIITHEPLPSDDPTRRCPVITKAKKLLNWYPKTDIKAGLAKTIDYFRGQLGK